MARSKQTARLPKKKKAQKPKNSKKQENTEPEDDLPSISSQGGAEQTGHESDDRDFGAKDDSMEEEIEEEVKEDDEAGSGNDFKVKLPKRFKTFDEFVATVQPVVRKLEAHIASDFTSLPYRKSKRLAEASGTDQSNDHNAGVFHFYGALVKDILAAETDHEGINFKFNLPEEKQTKTRRGKANSKDGILEEVFGKANLKSLELKSLKLDIKRNEKIDTGVDFDGELIKPIIQELVEQYDAAIEKVGDVTFRKSFFNEVEKENKKPKKISKSHNPLLLPLEKKVKIVIKDLKQFFERPQDPDIEFGTRRGRKGADQNKAMMIGGAYDIKTKAELEKEADLDVFTASHAEEELCRRLIEEYNVVNEGLDGRNIKLTRKLLQRESITGVSLYTALLAGVVYSKRIAAVDFLTAEQDVIEELLELPKYIPFSLTGAIENLHTKLIIAKGLDRMLEPELENCLPQSAYFPALKRFKEDVDRVNHVSANLIPQLLKLYQHKYCLLRTEISRRLEAYEKQLDVLISIFANFVNEVNNPDFESDHPRGKTSRIPPNKIKALFSDAKQAFGNQECHELTLLKSYLADAPNTREFSYSSLHEEDTVRRDDSLLLEDRPIKKKERLPKISGEEGQSEDEWADDCEDETNQPRNPNDRMEIEKSQNRGAKGSNFKYSSPQKFSAQRIRSPQLELTESLPHENKASQAKLKPSVLKQDIAGPKFPTPQRIVDDSQAIERQLAKKLAMLKSRMSLEEAINKIEELEQDPQKNVDQIHSIQEKINHAEEWAQNYRDMKSNGNLNLSKIKELVDSLDHVHVRMDGMEQFLENYIQHRVWRAKFEAIVKALHMDSDNEMDIEIAGQAHPDKEMVAVEELSQIIEDSKKFTLDEHEEKKLVDLTKRLEDVVRLEQTIIVNLEGLYDNEVLAKYEQEIRSLNVQIPQLKTLQSRIRLNEEVVNVLGMKVSVEFLEQFSEKMSQYKADIDPLLFSQLTKRLEEASKLQQTANSLTITQDVFDFDDISYIRGILKDIEDLKVTFDELDKLKDILTGVAWLLKTYYLYEDDLLKATDYEELLTIKLGEPLREFRVEDTIKACRDLLDQNASSEKKVEWVKQAIRSGAKINLVDTRIEQLYKDFKLQPYCEEGLSLLSNPKDSKELERFFTDTPQEVQNRLGKENLQAIRTEIQKVKDWKALYESIIDNQIDAYIKQKLERDLKDPERKEAVNEKKWALTKLCTEYTVDLKKYPDLAKNHATAQKYLNLINWIMTVSEAVNNSETGIKFSSFKQLEEHYLSAKSYQVPKSLELYKKIEGWYNNAVETIKLYEERFGKTKNANKGNAVDSSNKDSVRKTFDKHKNRPSLAEANRMKDTLQSKLNYISLSEEIRHLDYLLQEYENWQTTMEAFVLSDGQRLLESAQNKEDVLYDLEQIAKEIGKLKNEFVGLELRSEEDERKLTSLEWQYRTYLLMKNVNKDTTLDEWKKLLVHAKDDPDIDPTADKIFTKFLETDINSCKKYDSIIQELMKNDKRSPKRPLEDIHKLYKKLQKSQIKLTDYEKFVEDLISKCKKLTDRTNYLKNPTQKEPLIEYQKTLSQIRHLPVALKEEEAILEPYITAANKLSDYLRNRTTIDLEIAEKIINEYKDVPVLIPEAQKLEENYEQSRKTYKRVQNEIFKYMEDNSTLTFDKAMELSNKLDETQWDFDGQLAQAKLQAYILQIESLQKQKSLREAAAEPTTITFQALKGYVLEGRKLKKDAKDYRRLEQAVTWIEGIARKADEKILDLKKIKSVETLEAIPKVILDFVDYSQEVIEAKATILAGVGAPQPESAQKKAAHAKTLKKPIVKGIQPKPKPLTVKVVNQRSEAISALQELLQKHKNLKLELKDAKYFAEGISFKFPQINNSNERLVKFMSALRKLLEYPNIARDLHEKKFNRRSMENYLNEKMEALQGIDKKLAEARARASSKPEEKEDQIQKKVRTDESAQNMLDPQRARVAGNQFREPFNKPDRSRTPQMRPADRRRSEEARRTEKENLSDGEIPQKGTLEGNLELKERRAKKRPVPYDPEITMEETKAEQPKRSQDFSTNPPPPGSTFKIFEGLLKGINEKIRPSISLYSCNQLELIKQMPQIIDERNNLLNIQGKMSLQKFDAYVNDCFRVSEEKGYFMISGWIEAESFAHQESCQRIAQEFLNESSVGVTKYFDCAKIFFAHREQIPIDWTRKLDFKIKKIHQSTIPPLLAFILIYQPSKAPSDPSLLPKITPIFQKPYTEPGRSGQSPTGKAGLSLERRFSDESGTMTPEETFDEIDAPKNQRNQPRQLGGNNQYQQRTSNFNQRRDQMELENQRDQWNRSRGNNFKSPMQQAQRYQPNQQPNRNKPYGQWFQTPRAQQQSWPNQRSIEQQQPSDNRDSYPRRQTFSPQNQRAYQISRSPANSNISAASSKFTNTRGYPSRTTNQFDRDQFDNNSKSGSQSVRDILEQDNSGFMGKPPTTYSESPRYPSNRREGYGQPAGSYKADLLNVPLRNLEEEDPGAASFGSRGGYPNRGGDNYPSYKSTSHNFKPFKW